MHSWPVRSSFSPALISVIGIFILTCVLSLALGARSVPLGEAITALFHDDGSIDHSTIRSLRLPRTLVGILAGLALGLSGALMQALTRNPLADTGVLGINAGAALAMVLGIGLLGVTSQMTLVWFSFAGAGLTTLAVYAAASSGRIGATPLRLVLAGVAIGAILRGLTASFVLTDPNVFDQMLSWDVGTLAVIGYEKVVVAAPFVLIGSIIGLLVAPSLNIMALGDHTAQSLGAGLVRVRTMTIVAVMLLTGSATAAAGPIGFLGLMAPQVARAFCGADQRRIFVHTLFIAPTILLAADILGRLIMRPQDIDVGLVMAVVGAPILIWIVRKRKVAAL
ncbi:FecCD family ABC transporter permease [Aureimonas populi]|uniref:FecCD family ABC transporter permease n=1 Tax=Aureimonas populi TaxID=1701758 RepID=A0ABW5CNZ9_9HYPH|nr:iron chelate uptake ABC transporter family permease subunit [Aureimonas populi]